MSRSAAARSRDRVAQADIRPGAGRPVTGWLTDESLLSVPRPQGRTEAEIAAAEAEAALEVLRARRGVARRTMLAVHGCTGQGCRERAHGADRAVRDEVLDMLQLKPGG